MKSPATVVAVCLLLVACGDDERAADKADAAFIAQNVIKEVLKAPATADFGRDKVFSSGGVFSVFGYVDAENSFGAKLRMHYVLDLTSLCDQDHSRSSCWNIQYLEIDDEVMIDRVAAEKTNYEAVKRERERVIAIQQSLAAAGYDPGPTDGLNGTKTKAAIQAYQRFYHLRIDGVPSQKLLDHLRKKNQTR